MNIGDFIILKRIGGGSHADVFKARHAKLGYIRAIKVLKGTIEGNDDSNYKNFFNECQMLLKIGNGSHPNIVHISQPYIDNGRMFIEMDLIQGMTLEDHIKKCGFVPMEEVHTFIRDIGGALAYCHYDIYEFLMDKEKDHLPTDPEDGGKIILSEETKRALIRKYAIVHNDIHSNNIMLRDYDHRFELLDFGLAVQNKTCVKYSGRLDGALEFLPPEKLNPSRYCGIDGKVNGEAKEGDGKDMPTPQADIYSLGILMYEMLAGSPPFPLYDNTLESQSRVVQAHLTLTPPAVEPLRREAFEKKHGGETYVKDYPGWLEDIIMKCLSKQPKDRYPDAKALLEDYYAHLKKDAEAAKATPESGPDKKENPSEITVLKKHISSLSGEKKRLMASIDKLRKENERLSTRVQPTSDESTTSSGGSWQSRYGVYVISALSGMIAVLMSAVFT